MTAHCLDFGDIEGALGPEKTDEDSEYLLLPEGLRQCLAQFRFHLQQRWRTHPDLHSRQQNLRDRLTHTKNPNQTIYPICSSGLSQVQESSKAKSQALPQTSKISTEYSSGKENLIAKSLQISKKCSSKEDNPMKKIEQTKTNLSIRVGSWFGENNKKVIALGLVAGVFTVVGIFKSVTVIPVGKVGVLEFFGQVSEHPLMPGFHFINPFSKVVKFSTRLTDVKETVVATSKEGLVFDLDISLQYQVSPQKVVHIYETIGTDEEEILISRFRSLIRQTMSRYESSAAYGEKRTEITDILRKELDRNLNPLGLIVKEVLFRKVTLPDKIQAAIQEKLAAEQENQKLDFEIKKAKKEAERNKIEAQGKAEAQRLLSQGLTDKLLKLKAIEATEKLSRSDNSKIIIIGGGEDKLPLILQDK